MSQEITEVVALLLSFVSWVMILLSLKNPCWKESTTDGSVITTSAIYENLWMSCASDSTGIYNCRDFQSLLALPGYIQASRALMIAAVVLGTSGILATLVGMKCSKIGGENYNLKGKIAGMGGVFFLLQGMCSMISVSWYAANITQEFFNPEFEGIKYEIGNGLYIGWCSATLAICGGSCLVFACRLGTNENKVLYHDQPPDRGTVYSAAPESHHSATTLNQYGRKAYV